MKMTSSTAVALIASLALVAPIGAQAQKYTSNQPMDGETGMEYAIRINACDGGAIKTARFADDGKRLLVRCESGTTGSFVPTAGMAGGLGAGGIIAGVAAVGLIAAAASGSGSSAPSSN